MSCERLFPPPNRELLAGLTALEPALERVQPLPARHRAALPGNIRQLSAWLTGERDDLPRDYLTRPEYLAAYLRYFLPWNVYRQGRLLQGLGLDLPAGAQIVDLGAGPLTFLLSLWLALPRRRATPLRYLGLDRAGPALRAGARLYAVLAPGSSWHVELAPRAAGGTVPPADLLVMANFLNEIDLPGPREKNPEGGVPFATLLARWEQMCAPGARVLLVEPGTRTAGRRLAALRRDALHRGWRVAAPCPHAGDCPQPGTGRRPWCHFTCRAVGAPAWLAAASRRARLAKDRLSLSFLLLVPGGGAASGAAATAVGTAPASAAVRVVSEPFPLPDGGRGRYGCSARGLVLLTEPGARRGPPAAPGDLLTVTWPARPRRDRKSGALIVPAGGSASGSRPR